MTLLKIARMGHPVLRNPAAEVPDPTSKDIRQLLADMYETMIDADGTGLAAPQIHVSKRVMLFMADRAEEGDEGGNEAPDTDFAPMTALINPVWEPLSDEIAIGWEGCLSVPGLTGQVPRHTHIRYQGFTPDGNLIQREATNFHARVFQHEFDHLDGILYPMRMTDLSTLVFTDEVRRYGLPGQEEADGEQDDAESAASVS